jgi:hypothetical protein
MTPKQLVAITKLLIGLDVELIHAALQGCTNQPYDGSTALFVKPSNEVLTLDKPTILSLIEIINLRLTQWKVSLHKDDNRPGPWKLKFLPKAEGGTQVTEENDANEAVSSEDLGTRVLT